MVLSCLGLGLGGWLGVCCYGSEDWADVCFIPLCANDRGCCTFLVGLVWMAEVGYLKD